MNEKHVLEWTPRAGIFAQSTQIWLLLDCTIDFAFQNTVIKWDFLVLGTVWRPLAAPRQPPPKNRRKSSQKTRRKPNLLVQKVCSEWNIKYWMHRQQKKSIDTCSQESLITNLQVHIQLVIDNFQKALLVWHNFVTWLPVFHVVRLWDPWNWVWKMRQQSSFWPKAHCIFYTQGFCPANTPELFSKQCPVTRWRSLEQSSYFS